MKKYFALSLLAAVVSLLAIPIVRADGAADYTAKCATCHGADGKGKAAMATAMKVEPAALDLTKASVAATCVATVTEGKGKMPSYKDKGIDIAAVCAALPK